MIRKLTFVILLFLNLPVLVPQTVTTRKYYVLRVVTSGTSNVVTILQPASGARSIEFVSGYAVADTAYTIAVTKGGSVSGGSVGTIVSFDDRAGAPTAAAVYDGTVTGSTDVYRELVSATEPRKLGGGLFLAAKPGTQKMFTVSMTSASSGKHTLSFVYSEP